MLIEQALAEFRHALSDSSTHPAYEAIVAEGVRSARVVWKA